VSWRWIWYVNLPLAGFAFLMILLFLDVHNPKTKIWEGMKAIDWFGTVTMLGVTLMTLLGLDFGGETFPWNSPKVICLIVFGVLMLGFFIFSEAKLARYPLIPLRLFRKLSNVAALAVCFVHGFVSYPQASPLASFSTDSCLQVFISAEYYLPLYFQSVQEASPLRSGVLILPVIVTEATMGILTGVLIHRTGRYLEIIWIGTIFMTLGFGLLIDLNATSTLREIIPFQIVAGIGSGVLFEPPLIALQTLVSQDDTATATATFGFVRNVGLSLSIVIGGVVFQNGMSLRAPDLRASGLPSNITDQLSGSAAAANVMVISTLQNPAQKLVVKEAFAWSMRNMWILFSSVAVCGILATAFISKQVLGREHTETKTGLKKEKEIEAQ
jgi:MFS family permease